jgi:hypothetical protein
MDGETKRGKPSFLMYKLNERLVRLGITSSVMGRNQMIVDYITMKNNENQEVVDSSPPTYVMKIVEILKQNPELWHHNLKTTIKKVGEYFSYYEEIDNREEITEILEVIPFIYYKTSFLTFFIF